ncbi:MAG: hypothetical protein JNM09_15675 [Blastocatellia bacterium]|nr:hypothetical protein [Blastocatellia bacterium]
MQTVTLEKVLSDIRALSPEQQEQLRRLLNRSVVTLENDELPMKPRIIGTYTPKDRSQENEWLAKHQDQYAGQWVALDGKRLISHGLVLKEVMAEVEKAGIKDALVVRAESSDSPPYIGF